MPPEEWLELSQAAKILGVHPSTLRRWADLGKIAHSHTLTGRRRFGLDAVERARLEMRPAAGTLPTHLAAQIESDTRHFVHHPSGQFSLREKDWLARLSEEQILLFRYSGQRLLGLMLQYISRGSGTEPFMTEARHVAADYGLICYKAGLTIAQTADAFLHFRRSILETMQAATGLAGTTDQDGHRIFLRTIDFFDILLVATIESFARLAAEKMG
jgi:DNA-binding transcriptional MerR regulator